MLKKFIKNLLRSTPNALRSSGFPEKKITWVTGHITGILKDCNLYTSEAYTGDIEPEFTITTTLN